MKLFLGITLFMALISCSDNGAEKDACPLIIDSVAIIDSMKQGDVTYYLVHRIAGWHDKTEILELYNRKPIFDHCSRSNIEPIYGNALEVEQAVSHVYLNIKDGVLELVYKDGVSDKTHNAGLKLELK